MIVKKIVTGELDGKPAMWAEDEEGRVQRLARFDDEDSYQCFLEALEKGYFNQSKKAPNDLKVDDVVLPGNGK